jgi:pimeloyl-ACP methyl ester carboxylesterase
MNIQSQGLRIRTEDITLVGDHWTVEDGIGTVLLLHGGGQTRHSWTRTARRLGQARWNAVCVDARGHGDSGWSPNGQYTFDLLVSDVAAVASTLDTPPVLVGSSIGGSAALVAHGEQNVGRAMVLVDIAPNVEPVGVERVLSFMTSAPNGFVSLEEAAEVVQAYNPQRERPPSVEGMRKNLRQGIDGRWRWHWDPQFLQISGHLDYARMSAAARAHPVPTLLVRGQESDVVSEAGVHELLECMPHARYVDVAGAAHIISGDDNDTMMSCLFDFLDDL